MSDQPKDQETIRDEEIAQYLKDKADGKFKRPTCSECHGGTSHLFHPHKDTCSQFQHMIDDHYDSSCMRGTCKYCHPDYEPKTMTALTEEELNVIKKMRSNN